MNEKSKAPDALPMGQTLAAIWGPLALTDDELARIRRPDEIELGKREGESSQDSTSDSIVTQCSR